MIAAAVASALMAASVHRNIAEKLLIGKQSVPQLSTRLRAHAHLRLCRCCACVRPLSSASCRKTRQRRSDQRTCADARQDPARSPSSLNASASPLASTPAPSVRDPRQRNLREQGPPRLSSWVVPPCPAVSMQAHLFLSPGLGCRTGQGRAPPARSKAQRRSDSHVCSQMLAQYNDPAGNDSYVDLMPPQSADSCTALLGCGALAHAWPRALPHLGLGLSGRQARRERVSRPIGAARRGIVACAASQAAGW